MPSREVIDEATPISVCSAARPRGNDPMPASNPFIIATSVAGLTSVTAMAYLAQGARFNIADAGIVSA
jgi:hypothetical protein